MATCPHCGSAHLGSNRCRYCSDRCKNAENNLKRKLARLAIKG